MRTCAPRVADGIGHIIRPATVVACGGAQVDRSDRPRRRPSCAMRCPSTSMRRRSQALLAPHEHDDEPRPRIESHGDYVLGILLLPVEVTDEDRLYYQEIDFVATMDDARDGVEDAARRAAVRPGAGEGSLPLARGHRDVRLPPDRRGGGEIPRRDRRDRRRDRRARGHGRGDLGRARSAGASAACATTCSTSAGRCHRRATQSARSSTTASSSTRESCSRATSRSRSAARSTSCCARRKGSTRRATRSPGSATTCRARSRTTRTR